MASSQEFLMVRGADLVVLGVQWSNFEIQPGVSANGRPRIIAASSDARIVLTFPPQSIAEEKLPDGAFVLRRARLAGPSRVAFTVQPGTVIDLGSESILEALVAAGQTVATTDNGTGDSTAIELPWGLVVSVMARNANAAVISEHTAHPMVSPSGVNALWQARLRATDGNDTHANLGLVPLEVKPDPPDTTLDFAPLDAGQRQRIKSESASQRPELARMELSALGGTFAAHADWDDFEWDHQTTLGRDQRVKVLTRGALYPFGHRAEFLVMAERMMDTAGLATGGEPPAFAIAGMRRELVLNITEPVRHATSDETLAREFPFASVEILTRSFRNIQPPRIDTANAWDWEIYLRPPFAPDAIQEAINAVNEEESTLTTSVNERLAQLPQTRQQMFDQNFQSEVDLQTALNNVAFFDPVALSQQQKDIDKAIDLQVFVPETETGPDGETIVIPGAREQNQATQAEIERLLSERPTNQAIQQAITQHNFWVGEAARLEPIAANEFASLPRNIETFAAQGDPDSQRIMELRTQRNNLNVELEKFNAARIERHALFFTPHTKGPNPQPLMFPVRAPNAEGDIHFSLPLIFVSDMDFPEDASFPQFTSLNDSEVADRLEGAWASRSAVPLPGVRLNPLQSKPGAAPKPADIQEVHQITIAGKRHVGTFRPSLTEFLVDLPALRTLLPNQPERVALKLSNDFIALGDQVEIALAPVKAIGIDFTDQPERSGGLVSPKYAADVISRELGPVAKGALPDITGVLPNLSSVYKDATLFGFPLAKLIKTDGFEGPPNPPKIVPVLENGTPVGARMEWNDLKLNNLAPLRVTAATKFQLAVETSKSKTETTCSLSEFSLVMPPSGAELLGLDFKSVVFKQQAGRAPDLQVNGLTVDFRGALKLLKKLQEELLPYLGISGPKPSIDVTKEGVKAKYAIAIPSVATGAFLLKNIAIVIGMEVPFTKKPVSVSLGFASRQNPFALTVLAFGGGGYIDVQVGGEGITRLEASLEFGAMIEINLVIARGEVHALGGVHFLKAADGAISLEAYIRIGGSVEVLGLVTVSVELVVMLTYRSEPNILVGRATLVIEIDVTFFSESVSLDSGEYVLAGTESNTDAAPAAPGVLSDTTDDSGLLAWQQARRAYAEALS